MDMPKMEFDIPASSKNYIESRRQRIGEHVFIQIAHCRCDLKTIVYVSRLKPGSIQIFINVKGYLFNFYDCVQ